MLSMSKAERTEVIDRAREQYVAAASQVQAVMNQMRTVPRDSERAQEIEREYVSCLQDLGTTVSTVLDAREIDEIGEDGEIDDETHLAVIRKTRSKYPEATLIYTKLYRAVNAGDAEEEARYRRELRNLAPGTYPTGRTAFKTLHTAMDKANEAIRDSSAGKRREILREELGTFGSFGTVTPDAEYTRLTKADRASYTEALSMYPDALVTRAWENSPPVEVKKTTARAHYAQVVSFGPVRNAMVYHHPLGGGELSPENVVSAAERIRSTGSPTFSRSVTTSPENIGRLQTMGMSKFRHVETMFMEDTPDNRRALDAYVEAYNSAPGKTSDIQVSEVEIPGKGTRISLTNTGGPQAVQSRTAVASAYNILTTDGSVSTTIHELAHRMEYTDDRIGRACKRFLADRTEGLQARRYARGEMVIEDSFVDQYVGKLYAQDKNATEVFSVGMEAIATGNRGGLSGRRDPADPSKEYVADHGHRNLVIGLLAGLAGGDK